MYSTLWSINAKGFGKPDDWCILNELGLLRFVTSNMAISLNTISIGEVNFNFVGQGLTVLTIQSAHDVIALVAATDAARTEILVSK